MKNKKIIPIMCLFGIAGASVFLALSNTNFKAIKAYDSSSLPTTINLNDCDDEEIRSYYAGLNSLSEAELQGTNLLKNLKPILANNQKYYSYDSGKTNIWKMYEIIDRDWDKSPASSTTYGTYDANTNTITNYQYGSSASNAKNNPYIHALYINRDIENKMTAWDNHNQTAWGINQEHIWPKSHGFDTAPGDSSGGARGDPMHLWAGDGWTNNQHSNLFYGYVDLSKSYVDCGTKYQTSYKNYKGTSKTLGSGTVFEPQDSDKGDIARAVFYMVARYNNYAGATSGIDGNEPNLVLSNNLTENDRTGTSSANNPFSLGILQDLLEWNKLDPVDEFELHRNNLLYRNYTNNRNPFIDFPEWADYIWGTSEDGVYNSAVTGRANPALDKINGSQRPLVVNKKTISSKKLNEEIILKATTADDSNITWTIENPEIVSLSKTTSASGEEIKLTTLKEGNTKVTVTATVEENPVEQIINIHVVNEEGDYKINLTAKMAIIIGIVALIVIGIIVVFLLMTRKNKKARKKVVKTAKKISKSTGKSSSKSKKK